MDNKELLEDVFDSYIITRHSNYHRRKNIDISSVINKHVRNNQVVLNEEKRATLEEYVQEVHSIRNRHEQLTSIPVAVALGIVGMVASTEMIETLDRVQAFLGVTGGIAVGGVLPYVLMQRYFSRALDRTINAYAQRLNEIDHREGDVISLFRYRD